MFDKINHEVHFQHQALNLLTKRENILAANIANADTPGYRARDIDFSKQLQQAMTTYAQGKGDLSVARTSAKHLSGSRLSFHDDLLYRIPDQPRADDNTVDMDRERVNFLDNTVKHQVSITSLNAQFKNMMSAINQG